LEDAIPLVAFALSAFLFAVVLLIASRMINPPRSNPHPDTLKASTYECGETPIGEGRTQFRIQYFKYAIFFAVFDIAAVLILIFMAAYLNSAIASIGIVSASVLIIASALVYSWKSLAGGTD